MNSIIGSKTLLNDFENSLALEFNDCIGDLLDLDDVKKLDNFSQHLETSRLQHSINVSYYSFLFCRFLNFDYRSAARAGILHDLFLYDWRLEKQPEGAHAFAHPKVALRNAKSNVSLNEIEEDAILKHMFPLTLTPPKYKESIIVSLADKYCASCEVICAITASISKKIFKNK